MMVDEILRLNIIKSYDGDNAIFGSKRTMTLHVIDTPEIHRIRIG